MTQQLYILPVAIQKTTVMAAAYVLSMDLLTVIPRSAWCGPLGILLYTQLGTNCLLLVITTSITM